jgi:uroporphyrin-III C-methyltransferase/precorrin-2 dehydrogenase/sirohydrochlorin ferrochelatase
MYFPASLKVGGERCLVVGGGAVALRKARALRRAGARVVAVGPAFSPGFARIAELVRRPFRASDVRGAALVVSATDDPGVNRAVHAACRRRGIPVNVVDVPELCTFIVPSVVRRGPVTVAVSTGGLSPSLAQALRREIQRLLPASLGPLARRLGRERRRLLRFLPASPARTRLLKRLAGRIRIAGGPR